MAPTVEDLPTFIRSQSADEPAHLLGLWHANDALPRPLVQLLLITIVVIAVIAVIAIIVDFVIRALVRVHTVDNRIVRSADFKNLDAPSFCDAEEVSKRNSVFFERPIEPQ